MLCQLFNYLREWGERQVMYWQLIGNIKHVKVIVNLQLSRGLEMIEKSAVYVIKHFPQRF